jgi:hypothetical protein
MSDVTTSTERVEAVNYRRDEPIPAQSYSASTSFNVTQGPAYGQVKSYSATAYTPIQQSEQKSYTRERYGGYGGTSYNDVSVQESQMGEKMSYGLGGTSSYGAGFEKASFEETNTVDTQSSYGRGTYPRNYGDAASMLTEITEKKPSYGERTFGASFQESTTVQKSDSVDRTSYGGGYGGYGQNYTDTSIQESDSMGDRASYGGGSFGGYGSKSYADTTGQESESVVDKTYGGGGYGGYGMGYAEKTDTTETQTYGSYGGGYQETSTKNEIIDEEKSYGAGAYGGYSSNYGDNVSGQQSQTTNEEQISYGRGGYGQSSQGEISAQESFQKLSIQDVSSDFFLLIQVLRGIRHSRGSLSWFLH